MEVLHLSANVKTWKGLLPKLRLSLIRKLGDFLVKDLRAPKLFEIGMSLNEVCSSYSSLGLGEDDF